jgi:acetyl-CoA synthetase
MISHKMKQIRKWPETPMTDNTVIPVPEDWTTTALVNAAQYEEMYARSVADPDGFWREHGQIIDWITPYRKVKSTTYGRDDVSIKWFEDGTLNASFNCLDRHLRTLGEETAIIWEGDEPNQHKNITYRHLHEQVCKLGNAMRMLGVKKGDRVCIYMPMIVEAAVAMLACARIGAVHSVVFGGFAPKSLADRINDCGATMVITADEGVRGGKRIPLKANVDKALETCETVKHLLVVDHTDLDVPMTSPRDIWYRVITEKQGAWCEPEEMNAEDPLFILYTSGSTGKPKGVLHTTGGYMVYAAMTHKYVFDYDGRQVHWCTADVGWITGHTYILYGPLANGAITLMFEGVPNYPNAGRFWDVIDKHGVNTFYTAPTALRALMREGDAPVKQASRTTLRLLGSVGEPINPEAWLWYHRVVGDSRCPMLDTWWQTETGGIMITPLPGAMALKPGSASRPFFGVQPCLVDGKGNEIEGAGEGYLCLKDSWPGQMRTLYGDHKRFIETYFSQYPGKYFTGDGCRRDADGDYWITGRVDDVLNVSGHRMGTAEIESSLVAHKAVAEAAVVGFPHDIKGQGIYAYVTLMEGCDPTPALHDELIQWVRNDIGAIAKPDHLQWAPGLPKTRSGKIMRRILRKIAENDVEMLGDTSTLADPSVVDDLVNNRAGA